MHNPHGDVGNRRIELWRRAIFLFDRTNKEVGPFREAGYRHYWCEGKSEEALTPDIFGFSELFFTVCDISMSRNKNEDISKYQKCTPSEYMNLLFPSEYNRAPAGLPFLITDTLGIDKTPGYNLLQVYQPGEAVIEEINDDTLKTILERWTGFVHPPPSYSILCVPESTPDEIKKPLAGILKWGAYQNRIISINEIVNQLLGDIYTSTSQRSRAILRKKTEGIVIDLSKKILKDYLNYDNTKKHLIFIFDTENVQSRNAFSNKINEWLQIVPIERFLTDEFDNGEDFDDDTDIDEY